MKDFIDEKIEITGNDDDRIHRSVMYDTYCQFHKCNFAPSTFESDYQRIATLIYDSQVRVKGFQKRGAFVGVKFRKTQNNEDTAFIDLDDDCQDSKKEQRGDKELDELKQKNKILEEENKNNKQKYEESKNEIEKLKKQLESLQKLLETKNEMIEHNVNDNLIDDYVKTEKQKITYTVEKKEEMKKSVGINKDILKKIKIKEEKEKEKVLEC